MNTKTMESEILKKQNIPRMDYDIAKNSIKRIVKTHGKAGILAVTVIGCELSDLFDQVTKREDSLCRTCNGEDYAPVGIDYCECPDCGRAPTYDHTAASQARAKEETK